MFVKYKVNVIRINTLWLKFSTYCDHLYYNINENVTTILRMWAVKSVDKWILLLLKNFVEEKAKEI